MTASITVIGFGLFFAFSRLNAHSQHVAQLGSGILGERSRANQIAAIADKIETRRVPITGIASFNFLNEDSFKEMGLGTFSFAAKQADSQEAQVRAYRDDVKRDVANLRHDKTAAIVDRDLTLLSDQIDRFAETMRGAQTFTGMMAFTQVDTRSLGRRLGAASRDASDSISSLVNGLRDQSNVFKFEAGISEAQRNRTANEGPLNRILNP